ncbi:hypothetical protein L9F63_007942, partial [Diploptera punctata]
MAKEKYLTEEELVNILYNDDSGDELIPELEDSQSESEDELPLSEIDTPIPCDVNHPRLICLKNVGIVTKVYYLFSGTDTAAFGLTLPLKVVHFSSPQLFGGLRRPLEQAS